MTTIVVGVDGSERGGAALELAAEEAALRGAALRLVTAWELPPAVLAGVAYDSGFSEQAKEEARQRALAFAAEAAARVAKLQPGVVCEERVVEGQAAKVLLEEGHDAAMLVVGSRGHGGFAGLLLGSVSHQVVNHAGGPVLVVPSPKKEK